MPQGDRLQIMIVKGMGKVRTFRISSRLFRWFFFLLIGYLVLSGAVVYDWFNRRLETVSLTDRLQVLQHESEATRRALYQARQRAALLESHIEQIQSKENAPTANSEPPPASAPIQEKRGDPVAEIQDLLALKEGARQVVRLKVINLKGRERLAGYIHLVGMDENADPPQFWIYPEGSLKGGLPSDFKSGQHLSIRKYKTIKGEYPANASPTLVRILLYDEGGTLLLDKEFDLTS